MANENPLPDPTILYRGISFPWRRGKTQVPAAAQDEQLLADDLVQLLFTSKRERVMRTTLGTDLNKAVFENNDDLLDAVVRGEIAGSVGRSEPRILLSSVEIKHEATNAARPSDVDSTIANIQFVVVATKQRGSASVEVPSQRQVRGG